MTFERPKGMRDFSPQEKILREKVIAVLKKNFEIFGFNPLETPIVEKFETLASKYAGGAEILKETFQLEDQGKRKLGLKRFNQNNKYGPVSRIINKAINWVLNINYGSNNSASNKQHT